MSIICKSNPEALIKAVMLRRLNNGCPIEHKPIVLFEDQRMSSEVGLFDREPQYNQSIFEEEFICAEDYSLNQVLGLYEAVYGRVLWLPAGSPLVDFKKLLRYALRFNEKNNHLLLLQVVEQALTKGVGVVTSKLTPEAAQVYRRARQVWAELHRVKGFARFSPAANRPGTLIGRADFSHHIEDIVLKYFSGRYPGYRVILVSGLEACFLENSKIYKRPFDSLGLKFDEDSFSLFWETYYDSQTIEGRLNKELARKHIPQKLWSWVPEGKKLAKHAVVTKDGVREGIREDGVFRGKQTT